MLCQCVTISLLLLTSFLVINGDGDETATTTSTTSTTTEKTGPYDPKNSYCFEFTWLGPDYDNTIEFNATCSDYLEQRGAEKHVPCRHPLVITNDSSLPDIDYLWNNFKPRVVRRQRKGEVCAKYSYIFNNGVRNITYMRTKVFVENEGPVTSGCYTQIHGGTESELCICEPTPGDVKPCNNAHSLFHSINATLIGALLCVFTWMLTLHAMNYSP